MSDAQRLQWKADVDAGVERAIAATFHASPGSESGAPSATMEVLRTSMRASSAGGKRMRSILLLTSHLAHRGTHLENALGLAVALELFQTAALVHDDIIDQSDTRRGLPAAHVALGALHKEASRVGDAAEYGVSAAILTGDLLLMASHRAMTEATRALPAGSRLLAEQLFLAMTQQVAIGQFLDIDTATQPLSAIQQQDEAIRATMASKTASYTVEFPLALGAATAGATADSVAELRAIGVPLGIAFQLRDDLLGLVGEPDVTGKPSGDDLLEGKRTVPLFRAWMAADTRQREILEATVGNRSASAVHCAEAVRVIHDTGAIEATEREIAELAGAAQERLAGLDLDPEYASQLKAMFHAVVQRSH